VQVPQFGSNRPVTRNQRGRGEVVSSFVERQRPQEDPRRWLDNRPTHGNGMVSVGASLPAGQFVEEGDCSQRGA